MGNEQSVKSAASHGFSDQLPSSNPSINVNYNGSHLSSFSAADDYHVSALTPTDDRMIGSPQMSQFPSTNSVLIGIDEDQPPSCIPTLVSIQSRRSIKRTGTNSNRSSLQIPHSNRNSRQMTPRKSSLDKAELNINNGVTGKHLSPRIAKIASDFWQENIATMSVQEKLEVGCAIFFGMLCCKEMKQIMRSNLGQQSKIEVTSLKYLDMMGWLTRKLLCNDIDLYSLLTKLGIMHKNMGITIKHFNPMLEAMHETFSYYFSTKYNIEVKYAMDEIFTLAAQIMTGQDIKYSSHLNDIVSSFGTEQIIFLQSLNKCLGSNIGREYLYRYLSQTWCEELAIFLQSLHRFKTQICPKARFMIARSICKTSIQSYATFTINISYETRQYVLSKMQKLEKDFSAKQELIISTDFFENVEIEIKKLINDNHWTKFVKNIEKLQLNSSQCNE